jgi:hypothetical protein
MIATKSSVRRGDFVTLNSTVNAFGRDIPAGTKCQVWRVKRDGHLYVSDVGRNNGYNPAIFTNISNVTKVESPKPNVKPGDIFYASWGYDQTNIDFYQIVEVSNKTVKYVSIGEDRTYTGHMQGTVVPNTKYIGTDIKSARIRVNNDGSVSFKIASYAWAYPHNGQPKSFTEWA